jgi:hypothetical protein
VLLFLGDLLMEAPTKKKMEAKSMCVHVQWRSLNKNLERARLKGSTIFFAILCLAQLHLLLLFSGQSLDQASLIVLLRHATSAALVRSAASYS